MLRSVATGLFVAALCLGGATAAFAAANPSGTGHPNQSCEDIGITPGHSSSSPGSPFNEAGPGGIGGQHYSETSQYDVACFQVSHH